MKIFIFLIASLLALGPRSLAQSYTFTTLAGDANQGTADGIGNAARFDYLNGIAIAKDGSVYVADVNNSTIRRITPNRVVTTFAGAAHALGTADGDRTEARFFTPHGIAIDAIGNLIVADSNNQTIRKITPEGLVSTIAGQSLQNGSEDGVSSVARFYFPTAVALDASGVIYVVDTGNQTIRKITPNGVVTTLAGLAGIEGNADGVGAAARFRTPFGIAVDAAGNVYVADSNNNTIRKITPTGIVTTLAGKAGAGGYVDGKGAAARFFLPWGLAIGADGNIYVGEAGNRLVRKVTPDGVVSTVSHAGGRGIAFDASGNIYVTQDFGVIVISPSRVQTLIAGVEMFEATDGAGRAAKFRWPEGVALDRAGNLYVADQGNAAIRKVTPYGVVTTLAGALRQYGHVDDTSAEARFSSPAGLAIDREGNLIVSEFDHAVIRKVTASGTVTTIAGSFGKGGSTNGAAKSARFFEPAGIAIDSSDNIFVADYGNNTIRKITPEGDVTTFAGAAGRSGSSNGTGSEARFDGPRGLAIDRSGTLYVADMHNCLIRKVSSAGVVTTLAGEAGIVGATDGEGNEARFNSPAGVSIDHGGNLIVTELANNTIRKITPAGVVTTIGGIADFPWGGNQDGIGEAARFYGPLGVVADTFGNLFIADTSNDEIRKGTVTGATAPVITTQPRPQVAAIGTNPRLIITATGIPAPAYRWERKRAGKSNFVALEDGPVYGNVTTPTLTITSATLAMSGDQFRCVVTNGILPDAVSNAASLSVVTPPQVTKAPVGQTVAYGGTATLTVEASSTTLLGYQWFLNGESIEGATSSTLTVSPATVSRAGQYTVRVTDAAISVFSQPVILGVTTTQKVTGSGTEVGPDIVHSNQNVYDQVLLQGASAAITADPGQITRISYVDLDNDIVQVEFSGAGTLVLTLTDASGPALPSKYNQDVAYMKGHAGIVIAGANETTNLSVFSVGRINAANQSLFRDDETYDGIADIAYIVITSTDGKFGSVRTANASYFNTGGMTGIHAPKVAFTGPVYVGNIDAFDDAIPVLILGSSTDVQITGGDLSQANHHAVAVSGIAKLYFKNGTTSHGGALLAQTNKARLEQDGTDVTAQIVVNPAP